MTEANTPPLIFIGDIHGQRDKLVALLLREGLIRDDLVWNGGEAHVWFMGDFFDRGEDGIGVVELIMRWQREAGASGGSINALLGNHEILFLAAQRFHDEGGFFAAWRRNGGQLRDMELIRKQHLAWLRNLPAMALVANRLLIHADAIFYRDYGATIPAVNEAIAAILRNDDIGAWTRLLDQFSERMTFTPSRAEGIIRASEFLRRYGGRQIIHGHTPIQYLSDQLDPQAALVYSINLCVDVDGGMYLGGSGFVHRLRP